MTTLYGIPNCDTVKRARDWLATHGVAYDFHDFKKSGVPADRLAAWVAAAGWERVLNRKGTTWRKLPEPQQAAVAGTRRWLAVELVLFVPIPLLTAAMARAVNLG